MDNQVINDYTNGMGLAACSKKYQEDKRKIRKFLVDNNIHIRNRSEQCVLENQKRGYSVDHNYFSNIDSMEKAYYLGFFAADGTVNKKNNSLKISLSYVDFDHLEKIRVALGIESTVKHYITNNGFDIAELRWSSRKMKDDLKYYSIIPNKTYIGITLKNVPKQYRLAYFLGYYDGDGSFSNGKIKVCSHTNNILEEFKSLIIEQIDYDTKPKIYFFEKRNIYSLEFSTLPSIQILESLYSLDHTPYLIRKYNKFQEFKNHRI